MLCASCGGANFDATGACRVCGAMPVKACPQCGTPSPWRALFCGQCGSPLPTQPAPARPAEARRSHATAERRQLTVMFCDLVGSTALSGELDPEDFRSILREYQSASAGVIERYSGTVAQYLGDGILAYFGYPRAHEDDAQRAVSAGLDLVGEAVHVLGRLEGGRQVALAIRVAIHTGLVIAGEVGGGDWRENLAVGETPNIAARLQALAEPNTVVISAGTHRLVRRSFHCQSIGTQTLKGVAQPVEVYQVTSETTPVPQAGAEATGRRAPLGRELEIGQLRTCWQQACAGTGRLLLLGGEAGIGKSRLVETCIDEAKAGSFARLSYYCSEHHTRSPLYPVIHQMESAAGIRRDDPTEARTGKLKALLSAFELTPQELAAMFDMFAPPDVGTAHSLEDLLPLQRRQRTFAALLRIVEVMAARSPMLILFEDVHWIDPSSRALLESLSTRVQRLPVLVIATFRPESQSLWAHWPNADTLYLNRLDDLHRRALISQVAGGVRLTDHMLREIAERSDGNPLYVEELTKAILESQAANYAHPPAQASSHGDLPVPMTLNSSLLARLDSLGPQAKDVAQVGAVLGRNFHYALIQVVAGAMDRELDEALEALCKAEILTCNGVRPQASYRFRHALLRDAAYATLLRGRRRELHTAIANELAARHMGTTWAQELLAHHWAQADRPRDAARAWKAAARENIARGSFAEAEAQLRSALTMLAQLPRDADRDRKEATLQNALGNVLIAQHGFTAPETTVAFERARHLAASLDDTGQGLHALWGLGTALLFAGKLGAVLEMMRDAAPLVEKNGHLDARMAFAVVHGSVLLDLGRLKESRAQLENTLAMDNEPVRDRERAILYGQSPRVSALGHLSIASLLLDQPERSREQSEQCLREAEALVHKPMLCLAYGSACRRAWLAVDKEGVARHAQALLRLATDQGAPQWLALGKLFVGWSHVEAGALQYGVTLMTEGMGDYRASGADSATPLLLLALGRAYARAARSGEAMETLAEALHGGSTGEQQWIAAEVHRARAGILASQGLAEAAEGALREAITTAKGQAARLFEVRAVGDLARMLLARGSTRDAQELLAPLARPGTPSELKQLLRQTRP